MNETNQRNIPTEQTKRLMRESERLRIEFVNADLDVAMTFVQLARTDLEAGEKENAVRLLGQAERAADQITSMIDHVTGGAAEAARARLGTLVAAIGSAKDISS